MYIFSLPWAKKNASVFYEKIRVGLRGGMARWTFDTMSRFSSQITQFQSNNRGKTPGESGSMSWTDFVAKYMKAANDTFEDPDGEAYVPTPVKTLSTSDKADTKTNDNAQPDHKIYIYRSAHCSEAEGKVEYSGGQRNLAFLYFLEGNGIYCGTN